MAVAVIISFPLVTESSPESRVPEGFEPSSPTSGGALAIKLRHGTASYLQIGGDWKY